MNESSPPMNSPRRSWRRFLLLAPLLVLMAGVSFLWDAPVGEWIAGNKTKATSAVASRISEACDWPWLAAAALTGMAIATRFGATRSMRLLMIMLLASTAAGLMANATKVITGRTRPNIKAVDEGWYGMRKGEQWLIGKNKYNSFPSSHTACAAGFGLALLVLGWRAGIAGILFALLVAWSRLQLGVHHFSDVAFGLFYGWLGVLPFLFSWTAMTRWAEYLCSLGPPPSRGEPPHDVAAGVSTAP